MQDSMQRTDVTWSNDVQYARRSERLQSCEKTSRRVKVRVDRMDVTLRTNKSGMLHQTCKSIVSDQCGALPLVCKDFNETSSRHNKTKVNEKMTPDDNDTNNTRRPMKLDGLPSLRPARRRRADRCTSQPHTSPRSTTTTTTTTLQLSMMMMMTMPWHWWTTHSTSLRSSSSESINQATLR